MKLALLILLLLAPACDRAPPEPLLPHPESNQEADHRIFRGRVLRLTSSGRLVPEAGVPLRADCPDAGRWVVSGPDGRFDLVGIPWGAGGIEICGGYRMAFDDDARRLIGVSVEGLGFDAREEAADIVLEGRREWAGDELEDMPSGSIAGVVRSADGHPLGSVRITADGTGTDAVSGPDGAFRLEGLPNGWHALRARHADLVFPLVDSVDAGSAGVEFRALRGGRIEGVVLGPDGEPYPGVEVEALPDTGERRARQEVRADRSDHMGRFVIGGLGDLPYLVSVAGGFSYPVGEALRMVRPGSTDLVLRAKPIWFETGHRIEGVVVNPGGHGVEGVKVRASPQGFRAPVREDETDTDGEFCLMGLRPGYWVVSAVGPDVKTGRSPRVLDGTEGIEIVLK